MRSNKKPYALILSGLVVACTGTISINVLSLVTGSCIIITGLLITLAGAFILYKDA